jgi:hypothetical protein
MLLFHRIIRATPPTTIIIIIVIIIIIIIVEVVVAHSTLIISTSNVEYVSEYERGNFLMIRHKNV